MAPRANWKGYLRLSLVSCAVGLFPATSASEKVSFHLINRRTGRRLKQQYVDSETSDVVDREDRIRGYEVGKGDYVPVEEDELANIRIESSHTIDIEGFVERSEVDELYLDQPYYLAPEDKVGEEAFIVIREAMRKRGVAGLARIVLYGRERILLVEPRDKGLLGTTLHYDYEVRDEKAYFDDIPQIKIPPDMLDLASHILDTKKGSFDPSQFKDRYQEAVVDLVRAKRAGRPPPKGRPEAPPSNVINLMDALKRSIAQEGGAKTPAAAKKQAKPAERRSSASSSKATRSRAHTSNRRRAS